MKQHDIAATKHISWALNRPKNALAARSFATWTLLGELTALPRIQHKQRKGQKRATKGMGNTPK